MDEPVESLLHDWNDAGPHRFAARRPVTIQDETLREGLQCAGASDPGDGARIELLHLMDRLGVDRASLGIPISGARQARAVERLAREVVESGLRLRPNCGGRTLPGDVAPMLEIAARTGAPLEAYLFVGSSPIRRVVEGWDLGKIERDVRRSIAAAVTGGLPATLVLEDTTRSTPEDLQRLIGAGLESGATRVCVCDTVGSVTPDGARNLVAWLRGRLDDTAPGTAIEWHGHQDRGLALANALAALAAGADCVHATALGLGERTGNTAMEQLLVNLRLLGVRDGDLSAVPDYVATAAAATGVEIPAMSPVVGPDAFRTATGVHAAAVGKALDRGDAALADAVYCGVPASWLGRRQEIRVGPQSGAANARHELLRLGVDPDERAVAATLDAARRAGRVLDDDEIVAAATAVTR